VNTLLRHVIRLKTSCGKLKRFTNAYGFFIHTPSVFFSHSKHDRSLINYFTNIFAHIGLRGIFFEWQQQYPNYAGLTISNCIRHPDTVAVFVLMGRNVVRPPTHTP
jgi:hypothetical protein